MSTEGLRLRIFWASQIRFPQLAKRGMTDIFIRLSFHDFCQVNKRMFANGSILPVSKNSAADLISICFSLH